MVLVMAATSAEASLLSYNMVGARGSRGAQSDSNLSNLIGCDCCFPSDMADKAQAGTDTSQRPKHVSV
jgi:hypothetical protein